MIWGREQMNCKRSIRACGNKRWNRIIPLLEELLENSEREDPGKLKHDIDTFKPILSKETFNIMQILGFNFKKATDEPLTKLISSLISAKIPTSEENLLTYKC